MAKTHYRGTIMPSGWTVGGHRINGKYYAMIDNVIIPNLPAFTTRLDAKITANQIAAAFGSKNGRDASTTIAKFCT